jgi:hypothetical protein
MSRPSGDFGSKKQQQSFDHAGLFFSLLVKNLLPNKSLQHAFGFDFGLQTLQNESSTRFSTSSCASYLFKN